MAATRRAEAVWQGSLVDGAGLVTMASSGVGEFPVTWAARTETPDKTSPEELLAAAHASCYAMACSHVLTGKGNPPERLTVSAEYTFGPVTGVTNGELSVKGVVPGMDDLSFRSAAEEAHAACPISNVVRGNVEVTLIASLDPQ
jgi:osmotically inducible protein OsmC